MAIKNVGISPEPLAKSTFQREVFATLFGFHLSHSLVKVFGPEPKSGCSFMVFLATSIVAEKEGWISVFETLKVFEIKDPSEVLPKMKTTETTKTTNGYGRTRERRFLKELFSKSKTALVELKIL